MTPHIDHVADRVDDFLHGLLSTGEAARLARHCGECPSCKAALEDAERRLTAMQALPPSEASEGLVRDAIGGVDDYECRWRRRRRFAVGGWLGAAVAAALVIAWFHSSYARMAPSPTDLKVLGQTHLLAGAAASLRVCVFDHRGGGRPVAGTHVRIDLENKASNETVELAHFTTDAQGTGQPRFTVPDWGNADCELHVTAVGAPSESVSYGIKIRRSWQVMLTSDKPVYQPGQTIHVRSLALRRPDLRPVAREDVTFTVTDPKGNVIFKQAGKNSAYGIASADCPLALEIIEGQYFVGCTVGDTTSRLAVQVQKYVLPKFQVGVTLDRPFYAPGQKVTANVDAHYFFGQPVAGGLVELEVRAPGEAQPVHVAGKKTDDKGRATLSFELPQTGRESEQVLVTATVTDAAGQKQSQSVARAVSASPIKIEVIPEGGSLVAGVANVVYVLTTYPDGRPARTRLSGLEEFAERGLTTNAMGVASFAVPAGAGAPNLTIEAQDDDGLIARRRVQISYETIADDFLLRTDRAVYGGGDTVTVNVLGDGSEPVFVDLIKDGQTLMTETVVSADGRHEAHFDLPPDAAGAYQLCAYRLALDGVTVQKTRAFYVRAADGLQIQASADRPEHRPGQRAKLDFRLLDKAGAPVRGALSVAAVDEAVFSVLGQAPGSERQFFTSDAPLLKSVRATSAWSPDLKSALPKAEQDRFEQALFARTARTTAARISAGHTPFGGVGEARPEPVAPPHSLEASSFIAKSKSVAQRRYSGMERVTIAWVLLAVAVFIMGDVLLWIYVRPIVIVAVLNVIVIVGLCGLFAVTLLLSGPFGGVGAKAAADAAGGMAMQAPGAKNGGDSTRVRQDFPETLLWRPELITDDTGRASLDIDLADSITTWRLAVSGVTADGRLGATQAGIKVFQPFFVDLNLPVSLTRGDEVALPVVVYNYHDKPQTVELTLASADWFECLDGAERKVELAAHAVRSVSYRLRARTAGRHALQVTAKGGELSDAIRRSIEVVPDGRAVEQVANGSLGQPAEMTLTVPDNAVEGSARALVKIYPSAFSQLVEGLDGIFRLPYGCFEQTSSTTYPNVLALGYLRQTGQAAPEVKDKAERYIRLGYQRLLAFEVAGGGFDWFGRPPANRTLTAYGLMEFQDMARLHAVDPQLIERTRSWLLAQRRSDGSWPAERHMLNDGLAGGVQRGGDPDLATTAYVAWAVFGGPGASSYADATRHYLLSRKAESLDDPYVVALVANALNALDPEGRDAQPFLDRIEALKKPADDGKLVFWEQPAGSRTTFHGAGRGGSVETTALAALALLHRNGHPETTRRALGWLVKQKDAAGTWPSTQATVLALKALVAGTAKPDGDGERRIALTWDGEKQEIVIPKDQAELMRQIDLSARLRPGVHRLTLTDLGGSTAGYQLAFRYHVPVAGEPQGTDSLGVRLTYDRTDVPVGELIRATAAVSNRGKRAAPMVVVELPVPAGFAFEPEELDAFVKAGKVDKYQQGARGLIVYLRGLEGDQWLELTYNLRAVSPAKVAVPPARAYEYYDPDRQGTSATGQLTVR
jgi:hypothetical protein